MGSRIPTSTPTTYKDVTHQSVRIDVCDMDTDGMFCKRFVPPAIKHGTTNQEHGIGMHNHLSPSLLRRTLCCLTAGSAFCVLGPFWAERLGKPELRARQVSALSGVWAALGRRLVAWLQKWGTREIGLVVQLRRSCAHC